MPEHHYNTTHETGQQLLNLEARASSQEETILQFFKQSPNYYTPSQIRKLAFSPLRMPEITSVRRAMTNLTRDNCLIKTLTKRMGPLGHREHCWILAVPEHVRVHPWRR